MSGKSLTGKIFRPSLITIFAKSAKLIKLIKVTKPLMMFGSMAFSAFIYAFFMGPWFSIGLVVMLFIHEMGHVMAMRRRGFETGTPVFIPFLGAAIFAPKFESRDDEAFVGYGGPLIGTLGALALFAVWFFLPANSVTARLVLITSYIAIMLNLFNMIPLSPLDGGRITQVLGSWFQYVGVTALAILSILWRQPVILMIWVLTLWDIHFIPAKLKALIAPACTVGMITLMALGYSDQHWAVDIVDSVFTSCAAAMIVGSFFLEKDPMPQDRRPELSIPRRVYWLALYTALTIALVLVLAYQTMHLPATTAH